MLEQVTLSSTVSDTTPSSSPSELSGLTSPRHFRAEHREFKKEGTTGPKRDTIIFVRCQEQILIRMCKMTLDEIDIEADEEQTEIFTWYTIDAVCASYAAARNRVRQYTQLAKIYQQEADDWAIKLERASYVMPDYKP
ncbi:hypothetical protein DFJ58DRAFT_917182, partial [Suillus subalutaceus]|uniref:uncharacterized protein n=1 Tax=Suillus subalutaceus TaxID=48586 RepID=UPI001B8659A6